MLLKYPAVMTLCKTKLISTLSTLRGVGFNEKQRKQLIHENPGLIDLPRSQISKRIAFLQAWFTIAESTEVVLRSTEALTDHESVLKKKLKYLIMSASHESKSIVQSKVLSFPISRMKSRHEFLIRAGLFKPIPYNRMIKEAEKNKASKNQRVKYFPPHQVVCYDDKAFLSVCTNNSLTANELATFEELYAEELKDETDNDSDEDDELSSDDEADNHIENESLITVNSDNFSNKAEGDQFYF